jgi:hypothetical protein
VKSSVAFVLGTNHFIDPGPVGPVVPANPPPGGPPGGFNGWTSTQTTTGFTSGRLSTWTMAVGSSTTSIQWKEGTSTSFPRTSGPALQTVNAAPIQTAAVMNFIAGLAAVGAVVL